MRCKPNEVFGLSADIAGKRVLITGASRSIGAEIAGRFVELGADVVLSACKQSHAAGTGRELTGIGGHVSMVTADMADRRSVERLVPQAVEHLGGLDILVNNAGILPAASASTTLGWQD